MIEWLFNLDHAKLASKGQLTLQLQEPLAPWLWFALLIVVPTFVFLIYRQEGGRRRAKLILGTLRAVLILLVVLLLCQPALVLRREREEPSTVAILVDASASMARSDRYTADQWRDVASVLPNPPESLSCTRWDILNALLSGEGSSGIRDLSAKHDLRFFTFAGSASKEVFVRQKQDFSPITARFQQEKPIGSMTDIADSIRQVFDACLDAHLTAIVLLSDGQPTQDADWSTVERLSETRRTPIFVVPIGSPVPPVDLALENVRADRFVYLGDKVAIKFNVRITGMAANTPFEVVLKDAMNETVLARQTQTAPTEESNPRYEIQFQPNHTGLYSLRLEVIPAPDEQETNNNAQQLQVTVVDDRLRLLYVEGYPRYEYRYLKNTLLRELSLESSILLLSADESFVQEGSRPIRRFPNAADELNEYDVVLFGDVDLRAGWITEAQMQLLVDFVRQGGGGFGVIAGERGAPLNFAGTPLAQLIPVELSLPEKSEAAADLNLRGRSEPFKPQLTAAGKDSNLFRLITKDQDPATILDTLSDWFWTQKTGPLKPGAEVLLAVPDDSGPLANLPLLVTTHYGAGTILYQGSDDTWRWRRYQGEGFFDAYWLQVIRYLGRNKKFRPPSQLVLGVHPNRVGLQEPVEITLEADDPVVLAPLPPSVSVELRSAGGMRAAEVALDRLAGGSGNFHGRFAPEQSGQFQVVFDPHRYGLALDPISAYVEAEPQALENKNPQTNLELMTRLAESTGGRVVSLGGINRLANEIPDPKFVVPDDVVETIWDSKLALLLFTLLITAEWVLRKLYGMT